MLVLLVALVCAVRHQMQINYPIRWFCQAPRDLEASPDNEQATEIV